MLFFLFTRQQLALLQHWWNHIIEKANRKIKNNLIKSKEWLNNTNPKPLIEGKNFSSIDLLHVYYVDDSITNKNPKIIRILLNVSPPCQGKKLPNDAIDFFSNSVPLIDAENVDALKRSKKIKKMVNNGIKSPMETIIKNDLGLDNKLIGEWLLYLGQEYYKNDWITYCIKGKHNCQLTNVIFS